MAKAPICKGPSCGPATEPSADNYICFATFLPSLMNSWIKITSMRKYTTERDSQQFHVGVELTCEEIDVVAWYDRAY